MYTFEYKGAFIHGYCDGRYFYFQTTGQNGWHISGHYKTLRGCKSALTRFISKLSRG